METIIQTFCLVEDYNSENMYTMWYRINYWSLQSAAVSHNQIDCFKLCQMIPSIHSISHRADVLTFEVFHISHTNVEIIMFSSKFFILANVISAQILFTNLSILKNSCVRFWYYGNSITAPLCEVSAWIRTFLIEFNVYKTTLYGSSSKL